MEVVTFRKNESPYIMIDVKCPLSVSIASRELRDRSSLEKTKETSGGVYF